ncbi:endo-1,4-beta-xylanase [Rudanella lutea]|uniref:endo-1,4-beta-xylanase n=1 Tax=Rudanella lutea TaxID=451374 RepID=UPI00037D4F26|nr:endo-1,4-beta-xylanase [Rudanella lutea]
MTRNLLLFSFLLITGCQQPSAQPGTSPDPTPATPTLRSVASFPVGAAINPSLLTGKPLYRQTLETEFSSITSENHLKMRQVHPEKDRYDWSGGNTIVDFANQTGKRMHGHALVWHQSVPDWVTQFKGDSLAWENLLRDHITTVVKQYKGKIAAWDVVNEAFLDDGTLRPTLWLQNLGPGYIARSFVYARQADPAVKLFYNEYGQEYSTKKLAAVLAMVADFRKRNIPIDGVGLQMHTNIDHPDAQIENAIRQTAATGLLVHISELDVRVNQAKTANFSPTDALWQRQKAKYQAIATAYRTIVPPAQQHGITTWNVSDADSWIPSFCQCNDFPLPFDKDFKKKAAYDGFLTGLKP